MKQLKKVMAMGLATMAAVSAMSMNAIAEENVSTDEQSACIKANSESDLKADEVVGVYLSANGTVQTVTVGDVTSGNDTFTLVNGAQVTFSIGDTMNAGYSTFSTMRSNEFTSTQRPSYNVTPYSIDNSEYDGYADLSAGSTLYSNRLLSNGSSSDVMITAIPEGENLTNTTYTLYYYASSSRYNQLAQLSGGTTERSMNISNMPSDTRMFLKLTNSNSSDRTPFVSVAGY